MAFASPRAFGCCVLFALLAIASTGSWADAAEGSGGSVASVVGLAYGSDVTRRLQVNGSSLPQRPDSPGTQAAAEEEEEPSAADIRIAIFVVSLVLIQVLLLYHTHSRNPYVTFNTWLLIKNGLDIFLAVSAFTSVQAVLHSMSELAFGVEHPGSRFGHTVAVVKFALIGILLHLILWKAASRQGVDAHGIARSKVACTTFAGVCGHFMGFTWLFKFSMLQHWANAQYRGNHNEDLIAILGITILAVIAQIAYMLITHAVRNEIKLTTSGEGKLDTTWEATCHEAELDAAALLISFLLTQVFRWIIIGHLPTVTGEDRLVLVSYRREECLVAFGLGAQLLMLLAFREREYQELQGCSTEMFYQLTQQTLAFATGWCFLHATEWVVASNGQQGIAIETGLMEHCLTASTCTLLAMGPGFSFARLSAYMQKTGRRVRGQAAANVIASLSVMIGFSWERVFDSAVEFLTYKASESIGMYMADVTGTTGNAHAILWVTFAGNITNLVATIILLLVMLPAMLWYITPVLLELEEQKEQFEESLIQDGAALREERLERRQEIISEFTHFVDCRSPAVDDDSEETTSNGSEDHIGDAKPYSQLLART